MTWKKRRPTLDPGEEWPEAEWPHPIGVVLRATRYFYLFAITHSTHYPTHYYTSSATLPSIPRPPSPQKHTSIPPRPALPPSPAALATHSTHPQFPFLFYTAQSPVFSLSRSSPPFPVPHSGLRPRYIVGTLRNNHRHPSLARLPRQT